MGTLRLSWLYNLGTVVIVRLLSCVLLFGTPWTTACQASLSFAISWSLLKLVSIESVMLSNHLIFCCPPPSPVAFNLSQHQEFFQWVGSSHQVAKVLELSFSISPSNEHSGLISFRMNWLDLLAVQGTLKSRLQHHSSKPSILRHSTFFTVQLSHPCMTTGKTIALTRRTLKSLIPIFPQLHLHPS